ncbi:MAG: stage II sporulation protein D [Firmicutes bacterium]|nr:stage II sporulation protein D [Bacillota bacterium]
MAPRPGWGFGSPRLTQAVLYIAFFALVFVGIPGLIASTRPRPQKRRGFEFNVRLFREDLNQIVDMDLEEYLVGVLAGEMPADFHPEALKAQAVAARTYALYRLGIKAPPKESGTVQTTAHISSDFRTGQAWKDPASQREHWGWYGYYQKRRQLINAIEATRGEILVYKNEPIFAAYHSTSGGATQSSGAYFNELPYLKGVSSPGEEISPYYRTTSHIDWQDLVEKLELPESLSQSLYPFAELQQKVDIYDLPNESSSNLSEELSTLSGIILELYDDGRVKNMEIVGQSLSGRTAREKLGLRSNWFTVDEELTGLIFYVKGYGHGVGMSQYGAQAMALSGIGYRDILTHYYTGVQLVKWY